MIIDLTEKIPKGTRYLSGRDEGNDYKKLLKKKYESKITVKIPETVIGINMSFFLAMFDEFFYKFKTKEEAYEKIEFSIPETEYKEYIEKDIEAAIDEIFDNKSLGVK